jgi:hypothetical protein
MNYWRMPLFYVLFVIAWLVASFCVTMIFFMFEPDKKAETGALFAAYLIPTVIAYLFASNRTRRKLKDMGDIREAFPVIQKDAEIQPKSLSGSGSDQELF